jgi:hypothetical protein
MPAIDARPSCRLPPVGCPVGLRCLRRRQFPCAIPPGQLLRHAHRRRPPALPASVRHLDAIPVSFRSASVKSTTAFSTNPEGVATLYAPCGQRRCLSRSGGGRRLRDLFSANGPTRPASVFLSSRSFGQRLPNQPEAQYAAGSEDRATKQTPAALELSNGNDADECGGEFTRRGRDSSGTWPKGRRTYCTDANWSL